MDDSSKTPAAVGSPTHHGTTVQHHQEGSSSSRTVITTASSMTTRVPKQKSTLSNHTTEDSDTVGNATKKKPPAAAVGGTGITDGPKRSPRLRLPTTTAAATTTTKTATTTSTRAATTRATTRAAARTGVVANNGASSLRKYHVWRKSKSFIGPVIFLSWDDCLKYVVPNEFAAAAAAATGDFQSFDNILDAIEFTASIPSPPKKRSLEDDDKSEQGHTNHKKKAKVTKKLPPRRRGGEKEEEETNVADGTASRKKKEMSKDLPITPPKTNTNITGNAGILGQEQPPPPTPPKTGAVPNTSTNRSTRQRPQRKQPPRSAPTPPYIYKMRYSTKRSRELQQQEEQRQQQALLDAAAAAKQLEEKKKQSFNSVFDKKMVLLRAFQEEFGDADVPYQKSSTYKTDDNGTYKGLGVWVSKMRTQLDVYDVSRTQSKLSPSQVTQLKALPFCRISQRNRECKNLWRETQYTKLKDFFQVHGHTNIPTSGAERDSTLCDWVAAIRKTYHHQQRQQEEEEKASSSSSHQSKTTTASTPASTTTITGRLTQNHIDLLSNVKFDFRFMKKFRSFEEHLSRWLAYRAQNNGNDPPNCRHPIRKWISRIRLQYAKKKQLQQQQQNQAKTNNTSTGTTTTPIQGAATTTIYTTKTSREAVLTDDQIGKLTSYGFDWVIPVEYVPPVEGPRKTFEERVQDLIAYKEEYGDCLVPQVFPGLGTWVHGQRKLYHKKMNGEITSMTDERLHMLQEVGFIFDKQSSKPRFKEVVEDEKLSGLTTKRLVAKRKELRAALVAKKKELHPALNNGSINNNNTATTNPTTTVPATTTSPTTVFGTTTRSHDNDADNENSPLNDIQGQAIVNDTSAATAGTDQRVNVHHLATTVRAGGGMAMSAAEQNENNYDVDNDDDDTESFASEDDDPLDSFDPRCNRNDADGILDDL